MRSASSMVTSIGINHGSYLDLTIAGLMAGAPSEILHGVLHHGKDHAIQDPAIGAQVSLQIGVEDIHIGPA